ncbi:MAG: hypothetical protein NT069_04310 [Planctomycetota bacterium]|nr:hypothetical protein [Planctomycetota bacterium]
MAKFRLGDAAGARALLDQVREQSRLSNERLNDQNAKFLQEAEALLAKPAADTPGSPDAPPVSDTEPSE